jgi:hypothetical protein
MDMRRTIMAAAVLLSACGAWTAVDASAHDPEQEPDIRMLRDAAAALKTPRPELAQALSEYADRQAMQSEEEEGDLHNEGVEHEPAEGPAR